MWQRNEIVSDKGFYAVESFSNLLRDNKHLKVADFGLSLPKYNSASEYTGSNSIRSNDSLLTKPPKGSSCNYFITVEFTVLFLLGLILRC